MEKDLLTLALPWLLLTAACITIILIGLNKSLKLTSWDSAKKRKIFLISSTAIIGWIVLLLAFALKGFFEDFSSFPPKPLLAIMIPLPVMLIIAFSKTGTGLLKQVPAHWLIFMQSFRIIVEVFILVAFLKDKLPVQMTFEGRNFDILSGILALPVGYLVARKISFSHKLAIAYNIIGILLLINILVIAVLSMPTPFQYFTNGPANDLVGKFPFILLPGVLVPIAYTMHIFSLRQLLTAKKTEPVAAPKLSPSKAL